MVKKLVSMSESASYWLKEELTYIIKRNPSAARAISRKFREARLQLMEFPNSGRPWQTPGARRLIVSPYVLIVDIDKDGIPEIVNIAHSRQNNSNEYDFSEEHVSTDDNDGGDGSGG